MYGHWWIFHLFSLSLFSSEAVYKVQCVSLLHRQQYWRAGCFPFHHQQYRRAGCLPFHRQQYGGAGCFPFHHQQYRRAGCFLFHCQQNVRAECIHSTASSMDVQGVSLSIPSSVNVQGGFPFHLCKLTFFCTVGRDAKKAMGCTQKNFAPSARTLKIF